MNAQFVETDFLSWGRVSRRKQFIACPRFRDELPNLVASGGRESRLAIGLGRSYGDSCLNSSGALIDMGRLNHFLEFDTDSGILRAEAGVSFSEILQLVLPSGWFLPTTPGTRFITLGGAIANDVHGKNHHSAGSFGRHVRGLGLIRSDRGRLTVTPKNEAALFAATIGGMGLTGVIEWAEIQLCKVDSASLDIEILPFQSLDEFWSMAEESEERFEHTVAWIDSTSSGSRFGRGIFLRANWLMDGGYSIHSDGTWKSIPIEVPSIVLNPLTVAAFNQFYYSINAIKSSSIQQHYSSFFYPLDSVANWNRLYGRRGMYQYQCVVPRGADRYAIPRLLEEITRSRQASFLAVLKTFGELASPGLLSFTRSGTTLALDFPNRGAGTLELMTRFDAIVTEAGGALYPAKDTRMSGKIFRQSFPKWEEFIRAKDPRMNSDFWQRVVG